jgi:crotonobetainyl-CoA:carnitine CoA-transferase CaiB-like acyl-CoA transferase
MMPGALSNLRVLDLSRVLAGPWAGQLLGDLGAEVIKVERPVSGDETRAWGPPYLRDEEGMATTEAAYFLCANRNKKSVAINIAKPQGQALVRKLAACSDVLLENFKVNGLQPYGLDYASLRAVNPRLVYCSITGFGQTGPYATRPGYDALIQGMSGLMSITGRTEGEPGAGPQKVGVALTDVLTGLYAVVGIFAALSDRDRTGVGQHIDLALLDTQVACLANQAMNYLTTGVAPSRMGNAHPNIVPYQDFPTADGYVIIAVGNDSQFRSLCRALGEPQWADDDRFRTNADRVANRGALIALIRRATVLKSTRDWVQLLEANNVPGGPINTIHDVFEDTQVRARQMQQEMPHPLAGRVPIVANPIRMSQSPVEYRLAPPLLGEHTRQVLIEVIGVPEAEVEALLAAEVIGSRSNP